MDVTINLGYITTWGVFFILVSMISFVASRWKKKADELVENEPLLAAKVRMKYTVASAIATVIFFILTVVGIHHIALMINF